jgi:elongation factor Tu
MPASTYLLALIIMILIVGLIWMFRRNSSQDEAVPSFVPSDQSSQSSADFRLPIQDTFSIKGRGLVVTGIVESGTLRVGQRVQIASPDGTQRFETQVKGLEAFHKQMQVAQVGDNIGVLLPDLGKDQVKPGMVMTRVS